MISEDYKKYILHILDKWHILIIAGHFIVESENGNMSAYCFIKTIGWKITELYLGFPVYPDSTE